MLLLKQDPPKSSHLPSDKAPHDLNPVSSTLSKLSGLDSCYVFFILCFRQIGQHLVLLSLLLLTFYFDIVVDSHTAVRNNPERSYVLFAQFPPVAMPWILWCDIHSWKIDIDIIHWQYLYFTSFTCTPLCVRVLYAVPSRVDSHAHRYSQDTERFYPKAPRDSLFLWFPQWVSSLLLSGLLTTCFPYL